MYVYLIEARNSQNRQNECQQEVCDPSDEHEISVCRFSAALGLANIAVKSFQHGHPSPQDVEHEHVVNSPQVHVGTVQVKSSTDDLGRPIAGQRYAIGHEEGQ